MQSVSFTYRGKVRGQGRPKFTRSGVAYESREDRAYKQQLRAAYLDEVGDTGFGDRPVQVYIYTTRCLPKSRPKSTVSEPDVYMPDADNIAKAVLDAISGIAFNDDRQITKLIVCKRDRIRTEGGMDIMHVTIASDEEKEEH